MTSADKALKEEYIDMLGYYRWLDIRKSLDLITDQLEIENEDKEAKGSHIIISFRKAEGLTTLR